MGNAEVNAIKFIIIYPCDTVLPEAWTRWIQYIHIIHYTYNSLNSKIVRYRKRGQKTQTECTLIYVHLTESGLDSCKPYSWQLTSWMYLPLSVAQFSYIYFLYSFQGYLFHCLNCLEVECLKGEFVMLCRLKLQSPVLCSMSHVPCVNSEHWVCEMRLTV